MLLSITPEERDSIQQFLKACGKICQEMGRENLAEQYEEWAHEVMAIGLYHDDPAGLKNIIRCHYPFGSQFN